MCTKARIEARFSLSSQKSARSEETARGAGQGFAGPPCYFRHSERAAVQHELHEGISSAITLLHAKYCDRFLIFSAQESLRLGHTAGGWNRVTQRDVEVKGQTISKNVLSLTLSL
jgi:hypothetical protein